MRHIICSVFLSLTTCPALLSSQVLAPTNTSKSSNANHSVFFVYERARGVGWDWYPIRQTSVWPTIRPRSSQ